VTTRTQNIGDKNFEGSTSLWPFLKRLFTYSYAYPKWFWGLIGTTIIVGLTDAVYPVLWMYFLDYAVIPAIESRTVSGALDFSAIYYYGFLFLLNGFIQVIGVIGFIHFGGTIQEHVLYDLRQAMFEKLQALSFSFYDKSQLGWLLSRITSDSDRVSEIISWGFLDLIWGLTMIVFCIGAMFFYQWKLALIVLASIPILVVASFYLRNLILKYARRSRKLNSEITASYSENINGISVNKSTGQEKRVTMDFEGLSEKMRHVTYKSTYYSAMVMPMVLLIGSIAAIGVIYVGGKMALTTPPGITVGVLAASFAYATRIFLPILDISRFYAMAQGSLSAGERIFGLIDEEEEISNNEGTARFGKIKGDIAFRDLSFYYDERNPVLANLNLDIKAGESIALVGPTGEGKSTIVNLISRFYEPKSGSLLIDGIDYKTRTVESLRSQFGIVLQTPHLFDGTIYENLIYARPDASRETAITALKKLGADELVARLDEPVGEGGEKLSLGERQLVSFARAIVADPRIFIMDEATSSVDSLSELKIQKGIDALIKDRTAIIIAHRLSTIKNCDRILVIKKGQVAEEGSHQELINLRGKYYELYTRQIRELA